MAITLKPYEDRYLDRMVRLYNAQARDHLYAAPLTPRLFKKLVEDKSYFDPQGLFIAMDRGRVTGWVHACLAGKTEAYHQDPLQKTPQIRMLVFRPAEMKTGRALVEAATGWLKRSRQPELVAMHCKTGYPFYRGLWFGGEPMVPSGMPHLQAAFETCGYKLEHESVFMAGTVRGRPKRERPQVKCEFREQKTEMVHEPMRESWIGFAPQTIEVYVKGEKAGFIGWVAIPYLKKRLGAPVINIWGMSVVEKYRRKNIAAGMVSRVLEHGHRLGARVCTVGTQLWNYPAQAVYLKMGFTPVGMTTGRTLKAREKAAK